MRFQRRWIWFAVGLTALVAAPRWVTFAQDAGQTTPQPPVSAQPSIGPRLVLTGQITGTYSNLRPQPEIVGITTFAGSGSAGPLGNVQAQGTLDSPSFARRGNATGSLTLSNDNGTVILELSGPIDRESSAYPATLYFVVLGGAGQYTGIGGIGTIQLTLTPGNAQATPDQPSGVVSVSKFTLTFSGG